MAGACQTNVCRTEAAQPGLCPPCGSGSAQRPDRLPDDIGWDAGATRAANALLSHAVPDWCMGWWHPFTVCNWVWSRSGASDWTLVATSNNRLRCRRSSMDHHSSLVRWLPTYVWLPRTGEVRPAVDGRPDTSVHGPRAQPVFGAFEMVQALLESVLEADRPESGNGRMQSWRRFHPKFCQLGISQMELLQLEGLRALDSNGASWSMHSRIQAASGATVGSKTTTVCAAWGRRFVSPHGLCVGCLPKRLRS